MTVASIMTKAVNVVGSALTPLERWQAARRFDSAFMVERSFIMIGVVAVIILTTLFIVVSLNRMLKERRTSSVRFSEHAGRLGLTKRDREILKDVATRAKLRWNESIFTMPVAFNRGAAKAIEDTLALLGPESSQRLSAALSALREKLGFEKQHPASISSASQSNRPSSRQIPIGQKLHITRSHTHDLVDTEFIVIKNDDRGLTIRLTAPFDSRSGELCCVRCYFGASVWEFDASVVSCHGGILVLNHSDNVRFVNRRRFVRVPIDVPALVAPFPFVRTLSPGSHSSEQAGEDSAKVTEDAWGPPEFVPAAVSELAGPGLRVEAPLEVKVGDRVVVILKMSEERPRNSMTHRSQASPWPDGVQRGRTKPTKIVEDIGEVRHTETTKKGFSIAIELTGLSDSNVNELVRATNIASLNAYAKTQGIPASESSDANRKVAVSEPMVGQGV